MKYDGWRTYEWQRMKYADGRRKYEGHRCTPSYVIRSTSYAVPLPVFIHTGWLILLLAAYRAKFPVRCTTFPMICVAVPLYSRTVLLGALTAAVSLQSAQQKQLQKHGKAIPLYLGAYA